MSSPSTWPFCLLNNITLSERCFLEALAFSTDDEEDLSVKDWKDQFEAALNREGLGEAWRLSRKCTTLAEGSGNHA